MRKTFHSHENHLHLRVRILASGKEKEKEQFFSDNFSRFRWRMRAIFWGVVFTEFGRCSPIKNHKNLEKTSLFFWRNLVMIEKWSLNNQSRIWIYGALGTHMDYCITTKWLWENWMRGDEKMQNWHNGLASHIGKPSKLHFRRTACFGLLLHLLKFCIFFRKYQPI